MAKALVTGGGGFIGSHLTEGLLKKGLQVRVVDNFSTGKRENLSFECHYSTLEIVEGDLRDLTLCRKVMEGIDYVFHEAAFPYVQASVEDPLGSHGINVDATLNILLAARDAKAKRVIYASSCAVYGDSPVLPKGEVMVPMPLSPYALQKYIGEQYCRLFSELYGLETVSLRYFNIFGPRQDPNSLYSAVIPKFIDAFLHGRSPIVYGDGEQSRDFTYIENVVQANLLAMSAPHLRGEVLNIACGRSVSLNQLLTLLKKLIPSERSAIYQEARPGDIRHSQADISIAKRLLEYEPTVDFETGLNKTIEYFKKLSERGTKK